MRTRVIAPLIHDNAVWVTELNGLTGRQTVHGECLLGEFFTVELQAAEDPGAAVVRLTPDGVRHCFSSGLT